MAYRGEDLDLRTPSARGAREVASGADIGTNGTRQRTSAAPNGRTTPTFVDDTVLACCNHAYDIAQAHGASEVRLEHLVHALTRVEAAADILEEHGVREAHLRRESAAVIASEIPVGLAHSHSAPRASIEFEDVLRRASELARPRDSAADVHDLLWVLLNYDREVPAVALLTRHASNWQQWDWPHRREEVRREEPRRETRRVEVRREPRREQPRFTEQRPVEPRYTEPRPVEARYVEQRPTETRYAERRTAPVERVVERPAPQPVQPIMVAAPNLDPLHSRLDDMEQSLRRLQDDWTSDRRALTDLIQDLRDDIAGYRDREGTTPDLTGPIIDRLEGVERAVESRMEELGRTAGALTDRLHGLEKTFSGGMSETSRQWSVIGDRMKSIDKVVAGSGTSEIADLITEQLVNVTDRLQALEGSMQTRQSETQRVWSTIGDRLKSLDDTIAAQRLELQRATQTQAQGGTVMQSFVNDRMQTLAQSLTRMREDVASPVLESLRQVEGANRETAQALIARLGQLEIIAKSQAEHTTAVQQAHERDLADVHAAVMKLSENQVTLSDNLDHWRQEGDGSLGMIYERLTALDQAGAKPNPQITQMQFDLANRFAAIEQASARPTDMLAQMQTDLQGLQQVTLADYDHSRRGWKRWMFGTDEIFARNWRDDAAQVRARLRQMRQGGRTTEA